MAFSEDDIKKMTAAQKQTYAIEQKITAEKDKQKQIANDAITTEEKKKIKLYDQLE